MIEDTYIVTLTLDTIDVSTVTPSDLSGIIREATQNASMAIRKDRPFYKTYALSVVPFVHQYESKSTLMVTVIVALVPDPLAAIQAAKSKTSFVT